MTKIQVKASHVDNVYAQVKARQGIDEIDDAAAVTIASWWASPGAVGKHLASLATGAVVDSAELLADIAATRQTENYYGGQSWPRMSSDDRTALDALSTWVLQRTNAGRHDYTPVVPAIMRYASIVFQQGDDATETLSIIQSKGTPAGLAHLAQWLGDSDPYAYQTHDNPPHGSDDLTYADGDLILTYSHQYGYAGLAMRFSESH